MGKSASSCFHDAWLARAAREHAFAITLPNLAECWSCAGNDADGDSPTLLLYWVTILGSE